MGVTTWPADALERRPLDWLKPDPRNARTHSEAQVAEIVGAIRAFGWTTPILADEDGRVLAGHGRLAAARRMGLSEVPVIVAAGWSDEQKRLYALADNRIALNAGWDDELLALELGELDALGHDLALAGFSADELAAVLGPDAEAVDGARIERIETGAVEDVFWIQVKGPLADQAQVLTRLRAVMDDHPAVEVKLGTTPRESSSAA